MYIRFMYIYNILNTHTRSHGIKTEKGKLRKKKKEKQLSQAASELLLKNKIKINISILYVIEFFATST